MDDNKKATQVNFTGVTSRTMSNLTQDYTFYKDDQGNDHAKLSQRKVGELLKVADTTIMRALKSAALINILDAESLLLYGFDGAALSYLLDYFVFNAKRITDETRQHCRTLLRQSSAKGLQDFIDKVAGIPEPTPQNTSQKYLVGTWQEERELRKVPRKRFNSVVHKYTGSQDKQQYAKYSNKIYQGLFGCNAETLRNLPVVAGVKTIGRNHIPEAFEIAAVGEAEELISDLFESAEAMGYSLSLTRTIVFACFMVKKAFTVPHLGKSKSKATVIYQMLSKPSDKEIQYYLEELKDEYDF